MIPLSMRSSERDEGMVAGYFWGLSPIVKVHFVRDAVYLSSAVVNMLSKNSALMSKNSFIDVN